MTVVGEIEMDSPEKTEQLDRSKSKPRGDRPRGPWRGKTIRGKSNPNFEPIAGQEPPSKPKEPRPKPIKKKSRLIVRNLSFKVTDEKLKAYFEKYGGVTEVNILKKPNGKLVGCAFIQYQTIFQAANAIKELNLKPFLGRPIAIDWALPKAKYQTEDEKIKKREESEALNTENTVDLDTSLIKDETDEAAEDSAEEKFDPAQPYEHLKEEPMDVVEIKNEFPDRNKKRKLDTDSDEDSDSEEEEDVKFSPRKKERNSNDVEEGKTLFIRNLSFDTKESDLKEFFEKFGQLEYALICKDSLTEHPKGTGFVKFKSKDAAYNCLQKQNEDADEFKLNRRKFNVIVALPRDKVGAQKSQNQGAKDLPKGQAKKSEANKNQPKSDSRNLYLAREGFIRPGSAAAQEVSASDMNKRADLNRVKKQTLKNLNILISPTRLCIHNLPENFSDTQLRKIFVKHGGPGAKITEARVMRDMKDIKLDGKGKSKGFGFVNFVSHENALQALRSVNNNPSIFTPNNRPIVEFSMENRLALRAKEKRALKSKEKNPTNPNHKKEEEAEEESEGGDHDEGEAEKEGKSVEKKKGKNLKKTKVETQSKGEDKDKNQVPKYAGLVGKKGVQTLPSFKPKGKITRNSLKPKKTKKLKKLQERRQREKKVPSKRKVERIDKTEKLISKHKKKLSSADGVAKKKKRWFD